MAFDVRPPTAAAAPVDAEVFSRCRFVDSWQTVDCHRGLFLSDLGMLFRLRDGGSQIVNSRPDASGISCPDVIVFPVNGLAQSRCESLCHAVKIGHGPISPIGDLLSV